MKTLAAILALAAAPLPAADAPPREPYTRLVDEEKTARLETAVARFQNAAGVSVDLVAAIHIADRAYFESLNEAFKSYDAVLFELVNDPEEIQSPDTAPAAENKSDATQPAAGKKSPAKKTTRPAAAKDKKPAGRTRALDDKMLGFVAGLYPAVATMLASHSQMDVIDYRAKNFIHADLRPAEFNELQKKHGEDFSTLAATAGQALSAPELEGEVQALTQEMFTGTKTSLRYVFARMLTKANNQLAGSQDAFGKVLIGARNARAVEVLHREAAAGKKQFAIFYGAAHMPDIAQRLTATGFTKTSTTWRTAWQLERPTPKP